MRRQEAKTKADIDSGFPLLRPNAAGLDVGSREHYVAVPVGRDTRSVRSLHGIAPGPRVPTKGHRIFTAQEAGELLGVDGSTVIRWVEAGLLKGGQITPGAPWRIQVTEEDVRRLTTADTPKEWVTLKAAAAALRVSQQTVLQRLKSGQLEGVRVQTGRRTGWRIRLLSTSYEQSADPL